MLRFRQILRKLRFGSLQRRDTTKDRIPVENTDAMSAVGFEHGLSGAEAIPPNYVKAYDEGRPRK
jgi:hypothetical protein